MISGFAANNINVLRDWAGPSQWILFLPSDMSSANSATTSSGSSAQYATLHGLRGIAAFWVVLFHAKTLGLLRDTPLEDGGILTRLIFDYGRGGVAVFFVLSGFVIAHSVFGKSVNLRFIGRFALRRSVRLDPPYWISIIVALSLLTYRAAHSGVRPDIQWPDVLAHFLYLQELLGANEIQVIYWTLTYEIQFYLIYVFSVWAVNSGERNLTGRIVSVAVPAVLLLIAFVGALQSTEWAARGVFANYWFAFAAGVLAYFGGCRRSNIALALSMLLACAMLSSASQTREVFNSPAALTCMSLAILGRFDLLNSLLRARPVQALGSISYSLYLVHIPALIVGMSVGSRTFEPTLFGRLATFTVAIALALLLSSLFWYAVERPSHILAKRIGAAKKAKASYERPS